MWRKHFLDVLQLESQLSLQWEKEGGGILNMDSRVKAKATTFNNKQYGPY